MSAAQARVYVGAPSSELERARHAQKLVREMGARITFDWSEGMEEIKAQHPTDATIPARERLTAAYRCAHGVRAAHVSWILTPSLSRATIGAWVELGIALERSFDSKMKVILSGPTLSREATVLTELVPAAHHFESEEGAALFLKKMLQKGTFL